MQDRQVAIQLGLRIDSLREEIERKEMDVAYFESFPGLQHYGNELSEFVRNARQEIVQLRKDLQEKEYIFHQKMANIDKKEEIIHVFKEKNKSAIEDSVSSLGHSLAAAFMAHTLLFAAVLLVVLGSDPSKCRACNACEFNNRYPRYVRPGFESTAAAIGSAKVKPRAAGARAPAHCAHCAQPVRDSDPKDRARDDRSRGVRQHEDRVLRL